jgi:hypothetical protein
MPETQPGQRVSAAERRAQVVALRRRRATFDQIGRTLGISRQRAHQLYSQALAEAPAPQLDEHRTEELILIDDAIRDLMKIARDSGTTPRTAVEAWTSIRGWAERKAKQLGLDAPTRHEVRQIDAIDARLFELAEQMGPVGRRNQTGVPPQA